MRLACFDSAKGDGVGVVLNDEIADIRRVAPHLSPNPVDILAGGQEALAIAAAAAKTAPRYRLADVKLTAPVKRPGKILGIGLNYRDHAKETGREPPTTQMWFNKQATAVNGPFDPILMPAVSQ